MATVSVFRSFGNVTVCGSFRPDDRQSTLSPGAMVTLEGSISRMSTWWSGVSAPTAPLAGFVDSLGFAVAVARAVALLVADAVDGVDDEHAETATDRAIPVTASAARLAVKGDALVTPWVLLTAPAGKVLMSVPTADEVTFTSTVHEAFPARLPPLSAAPARPVRRAKNAKMYCRHCVKKRRLRVRSCNGFRCSATPWSIKKPARERPCKR